MLSRFYKIGMLLVLLLLAITQGLYLFGQWAKIPRADVANWRIEYASLNLDDAASHVLQMQLRAESSIPFKKSALPNLEVVITNTSGEPVGYQKFPPQAWVAPNLPLKNDWLIFGVASQTEITISMPLEIPSQASGFQVHLLY
ncbi:MAG: DUF3426 domain-containing protein [Betaproteobacteria bacterium]|jgi:hypothetical protein